MEELAGTLSIWTRATLFHPDGSWEGKDWKKGDSFVIQFLEFIENAFIDDLTKDITDTNANEQTVNAPDVGSQTYMDATGAENEDTVGIIVGTGTDAVANTQYSIDEWIRDGSASGELLYKTMMFGESFVSGSNVDYIMGRLFENGSGGSITVEEIGLYVQAEDITTVQYMIARDLLTVVIGNGTSAYIEYRFRTTV